MKVSEFLEMGGEFVVGDLVRDSSVINRTIVLGKCGIARAKTTDIYLDDTIISFSWRDLTTLPEPCNFNIEIDKENHAWRPLLEQGAKDALMEFAKAGKPEKPVYTQAMHDAGELPPVGSGFRVHKTEYFMVGVSSTGSVIGEHPDFAEYKGFHAKDCKPIQNDKEKAIEAMKSIVNMVSPTDEILGKLYDAGYRKQ